jgi:hypothetical protein
VLVEGKVSRGTRRDQLGGNAHGFLSSGRITGYSEITTRLLPNRRLSLAHNMSGVFSK